MWNLVVHHHQYQLIENYQLMAGDEVIHSLDTIQLIRLGDDSLTSLNLVAFEELRAPSLSVERDMMTLLGRLFPFMPDGISGHMDLIPSLFWPSKDFATSSVTFFGGSFNPWHEGHLECLRQCSKIESNLVIVPDYSPWKENAQEGPLEILKELSRKTANRFPIYPGFWGIDSVEKRNPTVNWLSNVDLVQINWLMGDDTFFHFLKWNKIEVVARCLSKIYVVPRDHKLVELQPIQEKLLEINPKLEIVFLDDHPYKELSSTSLRESS